MYALTLYCKEEAMSELRLEQQHTPQLLFPLTWWILDLAASGKAANSVFWFTPSLLELLFWEGQRIHFKEPIHQHVFISSGALTAD